jgi:hypothetical protein
MSVITDAEAWDIVQRLDAKAPALLKPLASQLGLNGRVISGSVVRLVWDCFRDAERGRDHYPYSQDLTELTALVNQSCGVALEPWHSWGLLCRTHKMKKNHRTRRGQRSPYLKSLHKTYGISVQQMRSMGQVPLKMAAGFGDDVAMTHIITRATNELFAYGNWGDWFDDRFTFNAMLACRKANKKATV